MRNTAYQTAKVLAQRNDMASKEVYLGTERGWVAYSSLSDFERQIVDLMSDPLDIRTPRCVDFGYGIQVVLHGADIFAVWDGGRLVSSHRCNNLQASFKSACSEARFLRTGRKIYRGGRPCKTSA